MTYYILQTVLFQVVFLVIYDIFHKKDTFFNINRVYLLLSSAVSLIIPLIKVRKIQENIPEEYVVNLSTVFISDQANETVIPALGMISSTSTIEHINWLTIIYFLGLFISLFLFIRKSTLLYQIHKKSQHLKIGKYIIIIIPDSKEAYSFWKSIYLGDQISSKKKEQIIAHEIIHLTEKHSLDLLWFELLKIVFWFNPLIYIYQSRCTILHEFIADIKSVQILGKKQYFEGLLNTSFDTKNIKFTNQFTNHSSIKKRIRMLQKSQTKSIAKFKYLFILPILGFMIIFSSFSTESSNKTFIDTTSDIPTKKQTDIQKTPIRAPKKNEKSEAKKVKTKKDSALKTVPFSEVGLLPTTINCKDISNRKLMKKCVSDEIKNFVLKNFDMDVAKKAGLTGENRFYARFTIDTIGMITNIQVRGPLPKIEEEVKRVISSLPQMIPGQINDQKVNVLYSLPVAIHLDNEKEEQNRVIQRLDLTDNDILTESLSSIEKNDVKKGYYLITNIFKKTSYLKRGIKKMKAQGLHPKVFKNPKDSYHYVYLDRYNTIEKASKMLYSNFDNKYDGDLYILKIK